MSTSAPASSAPLRFYKMNGLGNEIVVLDMRASAAPITQAQAQAIGATPATHFDQMMVLRRPRSPDTDVFLQIFNVDGSLAEACGNGTRCVADILTRESGRADLALESAKSGHYKIADDNCVLPADWNRSVRILRMANNPTGG